MSIGSVSFWQQDYNYWHSDSFYSQDQNYLQDQRALDQQQSDETALFTAMGDSVTLQTTGLAQIATQEAQARVNKQIAADEAELNGLSGTGSSSSSTTPTGPAPATGTGTVPLTTSTTLASLRIPPGGVITVSDGTNTTTYTSTGTDTVADLIGAINANVAGNAYVTATLNGNGDLVITGKNMKEAVAVGGAFAPSVGFGPGNQTFHPVAAPASTSSSSSSSASSSSSSGKSTSSKGSGAVVPTLASENTSSAATMLGDAGVSGSLVNMLV